jgi:hypothetical protein
MNLFHFEFLTAIFCSLLFNSMGFDPNENTYAFRVFENFGATKEIFLKERLAIQKLIETRKKLLAEVTNLRQLAQFE